MTESEHVLDPTGAAIRRRSRGREAAAVGSLPPITTELGIKRAQVRLELRDRRALREHLGSPFEELRESRRTGLVGGRQLAESEGPAGSRAAREDRDLG